jgi:RNA polymerase sigma-70 factor (ECF subfamily)
MSDIDSRIILSLKKNDESALREIFRLHFNRLLHFTKSFIFQEDIAREIVHEAIFRFWQHRHKLNDDTCIKAYLMRIVRNLCLNHLGKIKNGPMYTWYTEEIQQEIEYNYSVLADSGWDKLLVSELEEVLASIIANLPEKCRTVFELSRKEQLSNYEIASNLGISVKTVEGHITEALKIIRQKLARYLSFLLFFIFP